MDSRDDDVIVVSGEEAGEAAAIEPEPEAPLAGEAAAMDPEPGAPLAGEGAAPDALSPDAGEAWPQIQARFVDDPRDAVRQAAEIASGAIAALVMAARNREQALRGWEDADTEELRSALREYRDLTGRVSALAREI